MGAWLVLGERGQLQDTGTLAVIAAVAAALDQSPTRAENGAVLMGLPLRVTSYFPFPAKRNKTSTQPPQHH